MRTRSLRLLLAVTALLLLTACNRDDPQADPIVTPVPIPTADTDPTATPTPASTATASPTATASATPTSTSSDTADAATLSYFLLREGGERLWVEPVEFPHDPDAVGGAVARTALTEMLAATPEDGLVQPAPAGTELLGVDIVDEVLRIDLSEDVRANPGLGGAGEEAFAQALAHTGGQFPTVTAIQLLVEGEEVPELWGHIDWSQPIAPDEFAIVPIHIADATPIAGGGGSIEVAGTANVFEATLDIEVQDAGGNVVAGDFVTASCGTGCRGEWTHTFSDLGPGTWTVIAREPDPSGGEGRPPFEVSRTVTIP